MRRRGILAGLVAVLLLALVPAAAQAAASFPKLDPATVDGYRLTAGSTFATYGAQVAQLEKTAQLTRRGLPEILGSANRKARPLCHGTYCAVRC
ncbi:hypothetical protein OG943_02260 [Amycolatopsis sp. NBC_00345]|uniref:hypothetical protein n=1 Tax=Amycolatopsis sp. NBC_00345 TaxID=2975955 RepID=UPI002E26460B